MNSNSNSSSEKTPSECIWCLRLWVPKNAKAKCCSKKCSGEYFRWTRKGNPLERTKAITQTMAQSYLEIEAYLMEIKAKRFMANSIDIWKLIHLYDLAFFNKTSIPHSNDIERSAEEMFLQLALWYKDRRDRGEFIAAGSSAN